MNLLKNLAVALVVTGVSFGAMAAKEITKEEAKNYEKIGTITTSGQATSPMDVKQELSKLADEKGGKYYVIIAEREKKFDADAEVYK
ncbi:YdgH/BhsA/McbA-like domain containing protein [Yersinia enterocolitica]